MPRVKLSSSGRIEEPGTGTVVEQNPQPDPAIVHRDPMAEIFGPGTGTKLIGEMNDQIPDEVRAIIEDFGLDKRSFQCVLKAIPEGSAGAEQDSGSNSEYIKGWSRSIPSIDYLAKTYGPGRYNLCFTWKAADPESGEQRPMRQEIPLVISEKFAAEFRKYKLDSRIKEAGELGTKVRDELIEKSIEGKIVTALTGKENEDRNVTAKQYLTEMVETARMIGLPIGGTPANKIEWDKVIPVAITAATALLKIFQDSAAARQAESNKLMMLLLSQGQNSNSQLFEMMKLTSGMGSGAMQFKEIKDMIFGALDIKDALGGNQKEGVADRIFRIVEGIAPQILSIAATTARAQAQANNPMIKFAKNYIATDPEFKELKKDPAEMHAFIGKLDRFFGWRQADIIIEVAGWQRPPDCIRDPSMEFPPQNPQETAPETEAAPETQDA